uniref:Uncharacterized protein n=1 Tax=uncultured Desulfobacterium sp. TaxID=201089 RepID=E1YKQ7_9BACT|nr:unknown protein [uncultured Desulfobacterium sp.]
MKNINNKPCYKVVMTPFQGEQRLYFFDKDTFLITKIVIPPPKLDPEIEKALIPLIKKQYGEVPLTQKDKLELYLSDYRKVCDIWIPHQIIEYSGGYEIFKIAIKNYKTNIDMPGNQFTLPESIKNKLMPYNPKGGQLI